MNYESFKKEFQNRILSYLPASYRHWKVDIHDLYKVNRKLDAFSLLPPSPEDNNKGAYPIFYIQDLYEMYMEGTEIRKIFRMVAEYINAPLPPQEQKMLEYDKKQLQDHVIFQLINRDCNRELLKTLPFRPFLNLAVIYRVLMVDENREVSSMLVTKDLMKEWNMKEKNLFQMAWDQTPEILPFLLKNTGRIFQSGIIMKENEGRMYILSNESMYLGAVAMLYPDVLDMAAERMGGSFSILPGSLHELYLLKETPEEAAGWKYVLEMANRELVAEADYLSDNIYFYDAEDKTVSMLL